MESIPGYSDNRLVLSDYSVVEGPGLFTAALCKTCGAIVGSTDTHTAYHKAQKAQIGDD